MVRAGTRHVEASDAMHERLAGAILQRVPGIIGLQRPGNVVRALGVGVPEYAGDAAMATLCVDMAELFQHANRVPTPGRGPTRRCAHRAAAENEEVCVV